MEHEYYRRRLKANKMRRKIASTRKSIRNFRVLLRLALIFSIIFFGLYVLKMGSWYLNPELLAKADERVIKIEGNNITPKYKIIDVVRQTEIPHTQIFRLKTKEIEENISQLQPIKKVYVRRFWRPARIDIIIEERVPVFVISPSIEAPPIAAITLDGVFIDREFMPIPTKYKTHKIITYGVYGDDYDFWNSERVKKILALTNAFEFYSKQKVEYIDLRNPKDIYIKLDKVLIRFGDISDNALERAKRIATISPQTGQIKQAIKYIDLRWEDTFIKLDDPKKPESKPKLKENEQTQANN